MFELNPETMKTKITFTKLLLITVFSLGILFSSCQKHNSDNNSLSFHFMDGYITDHGWVVIHSLDGNDVLDYKQLDTDGFVDFGEWPSDSVTFTTVIIEKMIWDSGPRRQIDIRTYSEAPCGNWKFENYRYSTEPLGTAKVSMEYPDGNYDEYILSTTDKYGYRYEVIGNNPINYDIEVRRLEDGGKYSMYGAIKNQNGGMGGWLLDQDFYTGQSNAYSFTLDEPIAELSLTTSMTMTQVELFGLRYNPWSQLMFDRVGQQSLSEYWETSHSLLYPTNFPAEKLMFKGYSAQERGRSTHSKIVDKDQGFPNEIICPMITVAGILATDGTNKILNVQTSGPATYIYGTWRYCDTENLLNVSWNVYADYKAETIKTPLLPFEIVQEIGTAYSQLECNWLGLYDFNSTSGWWNYTNRFFIDVVPLENRFNESFSYYTWF